MLSLLGLLAILSAPADSLVFSGKDGQLDVRAPKLVEAAIITPANK